MARCWLRGRMAPRIGPCGSGSRTARSDSESPASGGSPPSPSRELRDLLVAASKGEEGCSYLLDVKTGKVKSSFQRWNTFALDCSLSRKGDLAALGLGTGQVYLWHTQNGKLAGRLAGNGKPLRTVVWSKDGKSLLWGHHPASGNALPPLERAFRLDDFEFGPPPVGEFHRAVVTQADLRLQRGQGGQGGCVIVWQGEGKQLATLRLPGERESPTCFTFLPDERVAVGGHFGLYLFEMRSGKLIRTIFKSRVNAVAPSPDGSHLAFATSSSLLGLYDLKEKTTVVEFFVVGNDWILLNPMGYYASSPGGESLFGWCVPHGPSPNGHVLSLPPVPQKILSSRCH